VELPALELGNLPHLVEAISELDHSQRWASRPAGVARSQQECPGFASLTFALK
jgi:hypothetical protein